MNPSHILQGHANSVRQRGITLVEIMIALVLSLLLLAGVMQIYLSNKQTFRTSEGLSRVQENTRYAMEMMLTEIRMAGYFGCNQETDIQNNLNNPTSLNFAYDISLPILGYNAETTSSWDPVMSATGLTVGTGTGEQVRPGSDILVVRRVGDNPINLVKTQPPTSAGIFIAPKLNPEPIQDGDILIISDCSKSTLFQVKKYTNSSGVIVHSVGGSHSPGNAEKDLRTDGKSYSTDAQLLKPETRVYYIGTNDDGEPTLKMKYNNSANSEELAEGVENLQVLYGMDTNSPEDGVANQYLRADEVAPTDWDKVVAVRIAMLVRSTNNIIDDSDDTDYSLLDETIGTATTFTHDADHRLRYVATSTIKLRNRGN